MARLSHLASKPNFDSSNDFSFSANTPRYISLREALNLTACGEMKTRDFYDQSPKDLCNLLDGFSQNAFGKTFLSLKTEEQKEVCRMLAVLVFEVGKEERKDSRKTSTPKIVPTSEVAKKEQKDFHKTLTPKIDADKPQPKEIIPNKVVTQTQATTSDKPQPKGIIQRIKNFFGWS